LMFKAVSTTIDPHHIKYPGTAHRPGIWVENVVGQAISRNLEALVTNNIFTAAGPCTKMVLYEAAAVAIGATVSGLSMGPAVGTADTKYLDFSTGLETRLMGEVARGTANSSLKRVEANEIVLNLLKRYESQITSAPLGKKFQECYDLKTVTPSKEWNGIYLEGKREIGDLGVTFD